MKSFETPKVRSYLGAQLLGAVLCFRCLAVQAFGWEEGHGWAIREPKQFGGEGEGAPGAEGILLGWG